MFGIYNGSTGTVNVSGNVTGGTSGTNPYGIYNNSTGTVNVYGTVKGGTSGTNPYGIFNSNIGGIVNIYGNLLNGNGGATAYGFYPQGILTVYGNVSSNGITSPLICGAGGHNPTYTIYGDIIPSYGNQSTIITNGFNNAINLNIIGNVYGNTNSSVNTISVPSGNTSGSISITGNVVGQKNNYGLAISTNLNTLSISGNLYSGGINNISLINFAGTNLTVYGDMVNYDGTPTIQINSPSTKIITYKNIYAPKYKYQGTSSSTLLIKSSNNTLSSFGNIIGNKNVPAILTFNPNTNTTIYAKNIQCSEVGYYPIDNAANNIIFSPVLSSTFIVYKGGASTYNILGSNTNTVSSLPTISNISGASSTLKTITFTTAHNISSTAGILSSNGFTDTSWNGIYGIVSIPSTTQLNVSGNFSTNPSVFGTSVLIFQTGYYGGSALVLTDNNHNLNTSDTVYSYSFYDSAFSWNGTFSVKVLSPSALYVQGPTSIPIQYGMIVGTKYFSNMMDPTYAAKITNIVTVPNTNVRSGYSYNSNSQTGNLVIPASSNVTSDAYVDNGNGVNVLGGMVIVPTSSVRLNTDYGTLTGTMVIPNKNYVSYNVPVDGATGVSVLDANSFWNYPVSSVNTNTVGSNISNIASKIDLLSI